MLHKEPRYVIHITIDGEIEAVKLIGFSKDRANRIIRELKGEEIQ